MNTPALPSTSLAIGEAIYVGSTRTLVLDGQEQRLEPRLAQLLDVFCNHPGEVLEREMLLERVWGDEGSDEALTQAVSRLRQMLGDRALIHTEPRRGYRLTTEPIAALAPSVSDPVSADSERMFTERTVKLAFAAGAGIAFLLSTLIALLVWPESVTVLEVSTQEGEAPPNTRTVRCEGDLDDCGGELEIE